MITQEQAEQIKKQLIQQVGSTFPEDKRADAISQIESMNLEQLQEFLIQNKLIKTESTDKDIPEEAQCIFCSIASGRISSYKIEEDREAIAVLEINPISKGHILIIPKNHAEPSDKAKKPVLSFAKKIETRINSKLKPKKIITKNSNLFGHEIINLIPVYESENIDSKRTSAKPEELEELKNILEKKQKSRMIKKPEPKKIEKIPWLKKRIP